MVSGSWNDIINFIFIFKSKYLIKCVRNECRKKPRNEIVCVLFPSFLCTYIDPSDFPLHFMWEQRLTKNCVSTVRFSSKAVTTYTMTAET